MNAYQSGEQKVIPAVLLYAFYRGEILMIHGKSKDGMPGKWNGLGGKLERGESMRETAVREFEEEALCQTRAAQWKWLGELYFPNFKSHKNEDWWVNVFITDLSDEQAKQIPIQDELHGEGLLQFVPYSRILCLDLWDGDKEFLPFVSERTPFEGTFFYEDGHCVKHEIFEIASSYAKA